MNTANKLTILRVFMIPYFCWCSIWMCPMPLLGSGHLCDRQPDRHPGRVHRPPLQPDHRLRQVHGPPGGQMPGHRGHALVRGDRPDARLGLLVVIIREFGVSGLRMVAADKGRVIAAGWSGKVKTASTMVCIVLMFLPIPAEVNLACVAVIVVTTLYSGVEYFVKNRDVISEVK